MTHACRTIVALVLLVASARADVVNVRGRVVDPEGKPIAGATVAVPGPTPDGWGSYNDVAVVARTTSGADGRFAVDVDLAADERRRQLVASADGFGIAWATYDDVDAAGDLVLPLVADEVVHGRIVGADGKPAAGVEIVVNSLATTSKEADFAEARKRNPRAVERMVRWLPLASAGRERGATTDADGRFTLVGLGGDRVAQVQYRGPGVGYGTFSIRARPGEAEVELTPQPVGWSTKRVIYGSTFEHRARPAQSVEGVVRDAASGDGVEGVVVQSYRLSDPEHTLTFDPAGVIRATTDANGRYRLDGFPAGKENQVFVLPSLEAEQAYFMRELDLPDGKDATIDVELHRGVWLTGKVTDGPNGKPVEARVFWTSYLDNPFAANLPEFKPGRRGGGQIEGVESMQNRYETKPDGSYRLVALPGPGLVWVWTTAEGFRNGVGWDEIAALKDRRATGQLLFGPFPYGREMVPIVREAMVPENVASETIDLPLDRGATVRVNVVDAEGKPVAGKLQVRGNDAENYGGWYGKDVDGPTFESIAWAPDETRVIWVLDDANGRGAALPVRFAEVKDGAVTVRMLPTMTLTGRVLDADGKALAGLDLDVESHAKGSKGRTLRMIKTDAAGRFTTTLVAGVEYYAQVWSGPNVGALVADKIAVTPGGTKDVGDVKLPRPRGR